MSYRGPHYEPRRSLFGILLNFVTLLLWVAAIVVIIYGPERAKEIFIDLKNKLRDWINEATADDQGKGILGDAPSAKKEENEGWSLGQTIGYSMLIIILFFIALGVGLNMMEENKLPEGRIGNFLADYRGWFFNNITERLNGVWKTITDFFKGGKYTEEQVQVWIYETIKGQGSRKYTNFKEDAGKLTELTNEINQAIKNGEYPNLDNKKFRIDGKKWEIKENLKVTYL